MNKGKILLSIGLILAIGLFFVGVNHQNSSIFPINKLTTDNPASAISSQNEGDIQEMAKLVASFGRDGDSELVHVSRAELEILKKAGGRGTVNPVTGLREYPLSDPNRGDGLSGGGTRTCGNSSGSSGSSGGASGGNPNGNGGNGGSGGGQPTCNGNPIPSGCSCTVTESHGCSASNGTCTITETLDCPNTPPPPIPNSPTGLNQSCPAPGTSATFSWATVPGATFYMVRADNSANPWSGLCDGKQNAGDVCQNTNGTTVTASASAGATFGGWWVHACNASGCSTPTSGSTLQCAGGTGTIQGYKVVMPGNQNIAPAAAQTVTIDGGNSQTSNPYFLRNVSSGNHTVAITVPAGYKAGYTLCYNSTTCHGNTPTSGSSVSVNVPAGGFADLWWHFTKTQCSDGIDNDGDSQIDYPQDTSCASASDDSENNPPTVTITAPAMCSVVSSGNALNISATAADSDGSITGVQFKYQTGTYKTKGGGFFGGGNSCQLNNTSGWITISTDTTAPYTATIPNAPAGGITVEAIATDNGGLTASDNSVVNSLAGKPQCSDGIDNDGDGKTDTNDPDCHTDGNAGNPGSYDPNDNDESGAGKCVANQGQACTSAANNKCSPPETNSGTIQCDGSCSATTPTDAECSLPNISCATPGGACSKLINQGNSCLIEWDATNATSCSVSGPGLNQTGLPTTGSVNTPQLNVTSLYTITCYNGPTVFTTRTFTCRINPKIQEI